MQSNADTDYLPLEKAFCAAIPRGSVSGWVGKVVAVTDEIRVEAREGNGLTLIPPNGMLLLLNIATENSPELALGNFYWAGVNDQMTQPHPPTLFPVGSPLYKITLGLKPGDTVVFSGSFVPFTPYRALAYNAMQSCEYALSRSDYFSLFRFSSIRRVGSGADAEAAPTPDPWLGALYVFNTLEAGDPPNACNHMMESANTIVSIQAFQIPSMYYTLVVEASSCLDDVRAKTKNELPARVPGTILNYACASLVKLGQTPPKDCEKSVPFKSASPAPARTQ